MILIKRVPAPSPEYNDAIVMLAAKNKSYVCVVGRGVLVVENARDLHIIGMTALKVGGQRIEGVISNGSLVGLPDLGLDWIERVEIYEVAEAAGK